MRADVCPRWAPPLLAVQFLTRLPVPALGGLSTGQVRDGLPRAVGWFPLVGTMIGVVTALVFLAACRVWPPLVAALLALAVEARLTGAFHEDAVADFCDAFGGGTDAEAVRRILKDSRIGSYGALGLCLAVGLRVTLTAGVAGEAAAVAIVAAATGARLCAVAVMATVPPAPAGEGLARDIGGDIGRRHLLTAVATAVPGLLPLLWSRPVAAGVALAACAIFLFWFAGLLKRRIGGGTGDCLGFAAYAGQLLILLAAAAAHGR